MTRIREEEVRVSASFQKHARLMGHLGSGPRVVADRTDVLPDRADYAVPHCSQSRVCVKRNIGSDAVAALFYSPVDCTDASDMHHSNASLMHR